MWSGGVGISTNQCLGRSITKSCPLSVADSWSPTTFELTVVAKYWNCFISFELSMRKLLRQKRSTLESDVSLAMLISFGIYLLYLLLTAAARKGIKQNFLA